VVALLWLLAARGDSPEYRRSSRLFVSGTAACAVLLAGSALLPSGARVWAWGSIDVVYLAGFGALTLTALPGEAAALTITDALIERFGLFTIIVLGETLTNVAGGLSDRPIGALTLTVGLVAIVVGFGAWWTYFDFAGHREARPTLSANLLWLLAHLPLTAAIAALGAAMVSLIAHAHDGRTPTATAWVLCAGTAVVLCATMLVAASLQVWRDDRDFYRPLARLCDGVALACLALAAARPAPLVLGVALVLLLGVPWGFAVQHRLTRDDASSSA
jgi:low temperature requirement protein LtrA